MRTAICKFKDAGFLAYNLFENGLNKLGMYVVIWGCVVLHFGNNGIMQTVLGINFIYCWFQFKISLSG